MPQLSGSYRGTDAHKMLALILSLAVSVTAWAVQQQDPGDLWNI